MWIALVFPSSPRLLGLYSPLPLSSISWNPNSLDGERSSLSPNVPTQSWKAYLLSYSPLTPILCFLWILLFASHFLQLFHLIWLTSTPHGWRLEISTGGGVKRLEELEWKKRKFEVREKSAPSWCSEWPSGGHFEK